MNYTNRMVSSDNMGYASYLLEQDKNPGDLPGQVTGSGGKSKQTQYLSKSTDLKKVTDKNKVF